MMTTVGRMIHRGWRIGLGAAVFVAAAATAHAQIPSQSPVLMLPLGASQTLFDGASTSKIIYDGAGSLSVNASATYITPKTPTGEQYLIVTIYGGPIAANPDGSCAAGYFIVDLGAGNHTCYTDLPGNPPSASGLTWPPGYYGSFAIRASYDPATGTAGSVAAGAVDACGVTGGGQDFCMTGAVLRCEANAAAPTVCMVPSGIWQMVAQGTLLTGKLATTLKTQVFGYNDQFTGIPMDQFEFLIEANGGALQTLFPQRYYPAISGTSRSFVDIQMVGCVGGINQGLCGVVRGTPLDWTNGFSESIEGQADSVTVFPFMIDNQNGQISGTVTDFNTAAAIGGASIQVVGTFADGTTATTNVTSASTGLYADGGLKAGTYTATVTPPTGYTVSGTGIVSGIVISSNGVGDDTQVPNVNFQLIANPVTAGAFTTYTQAQWGAPPRNQNAGAQLATNFAALYPTGLTIGGTFTIFETSAPSVQDFLPQEGRPMPLAANYVDPPSRLKFKGRIPHHRKLGSLAGETMALELNVRFSNAALTKQGLANLTVQTGLLKGKKVGDVLTMADAVLGGAPLPAPLKCYDDLEDVVEHINKAFIAGTINTGYVK